MSEKTGPGEGEQGPRDYDEDEETREREAEMADPREEEGTAPEGRHPGAQDWPQDKPQDD